MEQGLSILIPTYNHSVLALVERLSSEAKNLAQEIEILVVDDASTIVISENAKITQLANASYRELKKNIGRTAVRNLLAENAQYEHLLFLDADVFPVRSDFLKEFLNHTLQTGIIFGGITYKSERPEKDEILRWVYGHERETLSVAQRNEVTYSSINSGCFFIDKTTFLSINESLQMNAYGMDLLFKEKLKEQKVPVLHIDNPVYHLGLENNEQFLLKSLTAIDTTIVLEEKGVLPPNARKIQQAYLKLKKFRLVSLFQHSFSLIASKVRRNLLSENPNMRGFDLYRLYYYIQLKRKGSV